MSHSILNNAIDAAIKEVETLRRNLKKKTTSQVHSREERDLAKATALSWFNSHLPALQPLDVDLLDALNSRFKELIAYTDHAITRSRYNAVLKDIKTELSGLRQAALTLHTQSVQPPSTDSAPNFAPLISDAKMQNILAARWKECVNCIAADAPLAATVMMGGLLETLLLARFNREANKSPIFTATAAPKDKATGKTQALKEWTLRNYIDVAHELSWISKSAKDVGQVLRDFRNYIHPYKQASHGVTIDKHDSRLFWEVAKEITRQLIEKAKSP